MEDVNRVPAGEITLTPPEGGRILIHFSDHEDVLVTVTEPMTWDGPAGDYVAVYEDADYKTLYRLPFTLTS